MSTQTKKRKGIMQHIEKPHPVLRVFFIGVGIFFLVCGAGVLWVSLTPIPDLNNFDTRKVSQSTKIYDRTGKTILYDLNHDVRRNVVPLSEISPYLQQATISIEDSGFYKHGGVSFSGIARALIADITTGHFAQGGSTITQQVVKNTLLSGQKSITRKVQEWILAWKLEQKYTKNQVLEFYFNVTPYGGTLYGAEVASRAFYGKSASELNLAESAYLAAIPQLPTYYSPYGNNRAALDARKNLVLSRMRILGYITKEQEAAAAKEVVTFSRQQNNTIIAPHFVFYIEQYLENKYGPDAIAQGLAVVTTLDVDLQRGAETTVSTYGAQNVTKFKAKNAALVAIDPKTGQILAMVGSRDYFDPAIDGSFNIALAERQPGSSFKPFVYAAALARGYTPQTVLFDLPTQFSTACAATDVYNSNPPCYAPSNYDNKFRGPMTFTTALAQSINIPAVEALYLAGIKNVISLATNMGITTLGAPKDYGLSFALGAAEVRLLDITSAYGVFANDGVRNPPTGILSVTDNKGVVLEKYEPKPEQAIDSGVARQMNAMLSNNAARFPEYPANNPFHFPDYDVAAKTGTTNESRDAWTVGYTPGIAVGVWAGNNDNTPMVKEIAGYIVAPMWHAFMQAAIDKLPKEYFQEAPTISDSVSPILRGISTITENGVPTSHNILYWVNKDNPLVPAINPSGDSQFFHWEYPVQVWLGAGGSVQSATSSTVRFATTTGQ